MFRIFILLTVAVMLLPNDPKSRDELVSSAAASIRYAMTFCDRNPDYCEKADQIRTEFTRKAHVVAGLAVRALRDALNERAGDADRPRQSVSAQSTTAHARGTLTREDLASQWRAPANARN